MGSSRIHLRQAHIDGPDGALELWLRLLVEEIDQLADSPDWLRAARDDWQEAADAGYGFGVIPELDAFITNEEHRRIVLTLCERAQRRLVSLGDPISAIALNQLCASESNRHFVEDVPAAVFTDTVDRFIALIRDTPLD